MQKNHPEDKDMIGSSNHSGVTVRASRRSGSKIRYLWSLAVLLQSLIIMASLALPAQGHGSNGADHHGKFERRFP
jgi:hypothetical protein